jgi:hypothetical protein
MFGTYQEVDAETEHKAEAIRGGFGLVGMLARAFLSSSPGRSMAGRGEMGDVAPTSGPTPCPDAQPGQAPAETPCEKRKQELLAKAAAMRAARGR